MTDAARRRLARELADRCRALGRSLDAREAERRAFEEFLHHQGGDVDPDLYQDFLDAFAPGLRHGRGVYYTPGALVRAQVRLVDDLLRQRFCCRSGLGDEQVLIVDPAAGSGAYPLAVVEHLGGAAATANIIPRMRLFEPMAGAATLARARGLPVQERDALAAGVAFDSPIVVCLGNPPYKRRSRDAQAPSVVQGFTRDTPGVHLKNLYNDYVYFWRWALRVVFEQRAGAGIVCFVTAASYLRGPAFAGLRRGLQDVLDELWILDLEGDHLAARKTENVFPIRTPVAVALGARYADTRPPGDAVVHYARLGGSRRRKLAALDRLRSVDELTWRSPARDSFVPRAGDDYQRWPSLGELFPWQLSGAQLKRTWPIAPTPDVLRARWRRLLQLAPEERARAFRPTRDRGLHSTPHDLRAPHTRLKPLGELAADAACIEPVPYAYRSFDRQWVLPDARLGDFMRPALWRVAGPSQVFLTSPLTNVLGPGPAVVATALVPDLDHFRGSFGARAVIPLWSDAAASRPNVAGDWLQHLADGYGFDVGAEALLAYCYAVLATRGYVARFAEELRTPGSRVPLTCTPRLFEQAAALGQQLLALHTFRHVPPGQARRLAPVGDEYPGRFGYDPTTQLLRLGDGVFGPISRQVWDFGVSGLQVVPAWLRRRLSRTGASSLDAIGPAVWTPTLTRELLELLWMLEASLALEPALDALLEQIVSGACWHANGRRRAGP